MDLLTLIIIFSVIAKIFKKNSVKICFGKPYKIKTDDLTEANNELMEKVKNLIIKNDYYLYFMTYRLALLVAEAK